MHRTSLAVLTLVVGGFALPLALAHQSTTGIPEAKELHAKSIVVDTHDDTTQRLLDPNFEFGARHSDGNVDIPRMREGGLDAIFFSIWIPGMVTGQPAVDRALVQIQAVRRTVAAHPNDLVLCTTADEIRRAKAAGKIAALMGVEGGHMINNDLATLDKFYGLGVRYMTLTHTVNTDWADSSGDKPAHDGLTPFGKQVVAEMNKLGMMVDISHVSDKTSWDVIATTRTPVIASHSSARALTSAPRNMTDEMLLAMKKNNGVVMVNFFPAFIDEKWREAWTAQAPERKKAQQAMEADYKSKGLPVPYNASDKIDREFAARIGRAPFDSLIDHFDHVIKIAGIDHVGIGTDFDGIPVPPDGIDSAADLPKVTAALMARGYTAEDMRKLLGGNLLRVFREVQAAADTK